MEIRLTWDEVKRQANLAKHGLDFAQVIEVLESRYRLDIASLRNGETRVQSYAYVMHRLCVLTVVHLERDGTARIISFRSASEKESEVYYDWISGEND
ncbi:MAG: BrnT family toxin [Burkholderiaceae bacterium]